MAQRAVLAMAMACRPGLLIADEPTSGLDATLQQQVLELLSNQVREQKSSLLLITHDISVVGATCDQVAVMYGGRIIEFGNTKTILKIVPEIVLNMFGVSFDYLRLGRVSPGVFLEYICLYVL